MDYGATVFQKVNDAKSLYEDGESKRKFAILRQVFRFFKVNSGRVTKKSGKPDQKDGEPREKFLSYRTGCPSMSVHANDRHSYHSNRLKS